MSWEELHGVVSAELQPARGNWPKNGEYRYFCPFHDDRRNPNLDINVEKGAYICRACGKAGKLTDLARELGIEVKSQGNSRLGDAGAEWLLRKHGISPETASFFSIKPNFKAQAWQYPVFDWRTNKLLGYRYKSYDSRADRKYWEDGGIGTRVYFGRIQRPVVYLAEGEKDVWILTQRALPAACITGAATTVPDDLGEALKAQGIEEVRIIYDLDSAGKKGAKKVVEALGDALTVKVLQLPQNLGKGGDVADLYRVKEGEFKRTIENLPVTSLTKRKFSENDIIAKIADKGFLRSYVDYCRDTTDAPYIFHLGVGLTILGAALGNNVKIPSWADQMLYPNLWVVLIAPSGFMRKSASIRLGQKLLRHAVGEAVLPDDWTPEKLAHILQDNPAGLLTISEFTRILAILDRDYNLGSKEMLCELYDSPEEWTLQRKSTSNVIIKDASVSLLGATTLDWLEEQVEAKDLRGGFLARFLFLSATERGPDVDKQPAVNSIIRDKLKGHLEQVSNLEGVANYSLVWSDFRSWLRNYERLAESGEMPAELVGMYSRTGTTTLKLALVFQASLTPQLEITPEAMEKAQAFIEYIHEVTGRVTRTFADGRFGRLLVKVQQFLEKQGGEATRQEVMRHTRVESRVLDRVQETLFEQGVIDIKTGESKGPGRRPKIYVLEEKS